MACPWPARHREAKADSEPRKGTELHSCYFAPKGMLEALATLEPKSRQHLLDPLETDPMHRIQRTKLGLRLHLIGFCSLPNSVPSHPQTNAECSKPRAVRYSI